MEIHVICLHVVAYTSFPLHHIVWLNIFLNYDLKAYILLLWDFNFYPWSNLQTLLYSCIIPEILTFSLSTEFMLFCLYVIRKICLVTGTFTNPLVLLFKTLLFKSKPFCRISLPDIIQFKPFCYVCLWEILNFWSVSYWASKQTRNKLEGTLFSTDL